jgi:hypothetical protein
MTSPDTENTRAARRSRVMLYAPCYIDAEAAMDLATELARQIKAELHGILLRDRALMTETRGPVAAVVSYAGNPTRNVSSQSMIDAFQADARRFRDSLLRQAREAALSAAFEETEERLTEAMAHSAAASDVLVVGFKPMGRTGDALVVVLDDGQDMPDYAKALAQRLNKRLVALRFGADQTDLLARLDRMSPAAVLLAGTQSALPPLARIVDTARCPVIVWRPPDPE